MCERRGLHDLRLLCAGPGRVGQALAIVHGYNGHRLDLKPFEVLAADRHHDVVVGPRIGISKAADVPWRFGLAGSPFLSRRFPPRPPSFAHERRVACNPPACAPRLAGARAQSRRTVTLPSRSTMVTGGLRISVITVVGGAAPAPMAAVSGAAGARAMAESVGITVKVDMLARAAACGATSTISPASTV